MSPEFWEITTRVGVIVFYLAAFVMGVVAVHRSHLWARRRSAIAIIIASAGWLAFYLYLVDQNIHVASTVVIWSRAFHYIGAAALITMAHSIIVAERLNGQYEITVTLDQDTASIMEV